MYTNETLIEGFCHTLGNTLIPGRLLQVIEHLKNNPEYYNDVALLLEIYDSEITTKLQSELLRQRSKNSNPEKFRQLFRSCRRSPECIDKTKTILDILNYATGQVMVRFLNHHNASLSSIRNKILSKKDLTLDNLKLHFEQIVLLNKTSCATDWVNKNLLQFQIVEFSPSWQKVIILAESYAEALLFGYFSEILFNAFKYSNYDTDQFITVRFGETCINGIIYLTCSLSNPLSDKCLTSLGTGNGLKAILEDLKQLNNTESKSNSMSVISVGNQFQVNMFFQKDLLIDEIPIPKFTFSE